jgi:hypothetical protein
MENRYKKLLNMLLEKTFYVLLQHSKSLVRFNCVYIVWEQGKKERQEQKKTLLDIHVYIKTGCPPCLLQRRKIWKEHTQPNRNKNKGLVSLEGLCGDQFAWYHVFRITLFPPTKKFSL